MLSRTISLIRVFHNLTRAEVAEKVGISRSYLSELESGQKKITLDVLEKYSQAFNIPMSSLLLFDETASSGRFEDALRLKLTGRIVKMLEWLAEISDDDNDTKIKVAREEGVG